MDEISELRSRLQDANSRIRDLTAQIQFLTALHEQARTTIRQFVRSVRNIEQCFSEFRSQGENWLAKSLAEPKRDPVLLRYPSMVDALHTDVQ